MEPAPADKSRPTPLTPVPMPKGIEDLVDERLGSLAGQQSHVLQLSELAFQVLAKFGLEVAPVPIAAEITSVLYAAKVKQLAGLLREKERDVCDRALNKFDGSYDKANFAVVQSGVHKRIDEQIHKLHRAILDHEETLSELSADL